MPKQKFVDFRAVKAAITMEQVLTHYDVLDRFKRSGDSLSGPCPIHQGENPTQFRVSISKSIWNCFSQCKCGGNVLDFISRMENVSIHGAALKAIKWFDLNPESMSVNTDEERQIDAPKEDTVSRPKPVAKKAVVVPEKSTPNPPLKFRLDKLERDHPYLTERGLTLETIMDFGVGYCSKGMMVERIAIPIRNADGQVVAYAGRVVDESDEDTPKYKLPPGFKKRLELYNLDRAIEESEDKPLVIVEGFFDCMMLHQHGCRKVVALMGDSMSTDQEELIRQHTTKKSHVIVMLDENDAGKAGRDDIACRLSKWCFVKVHTFDTPDAEPEHLSAEEVQTLLG
jgi:DNA primase